MEKGYILEKYFQKNFIFYLSLSAGKQFFCQLDIQKSCLIWIN